MTEPKTLPELFADTLTTALELLRGASPDTSGFIPKLTQSETAAKIIRTVSRVCQTAPTDHGPIAAVEYLAECANTLVESDAERDQEIGILRGDLSLLRSQLAGKVEAANAVVGKLAADQADEIKSLRADVENLRDQFLAKVQVAIQQGDEIKSLREQLVTKIGARDRAERFDQAGEIQRLVDVDRIKSDRVYKLEHELACAREAGRSLSERVTVLDDQLNDAVSNPRIDAVVLAKLDEIGCFTGGSTATSTERVLLALQHVLDVEYALDIGSSAMSELRDDSLGYAVALDAASSINRVDEVLRELAQAFANLTYVTRAYTTAVGALAQLGTQTSGLAALLTREMKLPHPHMTEPAATPSEETQS